MGPHSFERGNTVIGREEEVRRDASMGPHSFERGNLSYAPIGIKASIGFNGASLFRARKQAQVRPVRREPFASMGPHSFERGNMD